MAKQETTGERNWYAIHTYVGYENAVLRNLKQRIESLGMEDKIFNVLIPLEKKIKVKAGKRVEIEEKIVPGYILVDMIVTDDSWYVVRNTPRVTGFVGAGVTPVPLEKKEADALFSRMASNTPKHNIDLVVGDQVSIIDGPFKELEGKVSEVDNERGRAKVLVSMFGRETPVTRVDSQNLGIYDNLNKNGKENNKKGKGTDSRRQSNAGASFGARAWSGWSKHW
jgi:transcriptional antiterminator NusG